MPFAAAVPGPTSRHVRNFCGDRLRIRPESLVQLSLNFIGQHLTQCALHVNYLRSGKINRAMPTLQNELKKRGPFASVEQEAMLSILRTSDLLENRLARLLREYGLTPSQYNVLRILRGEGKPMPCLEVAQRMIQVAPAITRVVDQLLKLNFINKNRSADDGRVFMIELKPSGTRLLKKLDRPMLDLHTSLMECVTKAEQKSLIRILEAVRTGITA